MVQIQEKDIILDGQHNVITNARWEELIEALEPLLEEFSFHISNFVILENKKSVRKYLKEYE